MKSDGDGRSDGRTAYAFKVDDLIASAGPDYVVPEILPGIVCRECGGDLKFKRIMMPPDG